MARVSLPLSAPPRRPRRGYAALRELFRAPSGAGCVRRGSPRSISGRCKISRNLRKRPECGAAIGPPGRGLGRAGEGGSEEVDGKAEGRGGLAEGGCHSVPTLASTAFFFSCQKSRPPVLLPLWSTAPHTHGPRPRPSPGISHWKWAGPTQCRRWCSWHNSSSDGLAFVRSHSNLLLCALSCPSRGGGGFSAERTQSVPAGLGEMRTWGWALQLRIARVCSLSRYCEAVVLNVSLFDLQELKFSCHQIILKY